MTDPANEASPQDDDGPLNGRTELRIAFCGGGSGGHLTPAIALARSWIRKHPEIRFHFLFLCSGRKVDQTVLAEAQLERCDVNVVPQTATTSSRKLSLLNALRKDFSAARRRFKEQPPDIVFGTGGFASVAPVLAARWLGHRPAIWEMNAVPGRATRWLSRFVLATFQGWPMAETAEKSLKKLAIPIGIAVESNEQRGPTTTSVKKTLLIVGGSLGASRLNDLVCDAIAANHRLLRDWQIIHQTGPHWQPSVHQLESCDGLNWTRQTFIPKLAEQFQYADIVISRAGAVTLAEIANAQVASILVPLLSAADDHQAANAELFEKSGAAFTVSETKPSASAELANRLETLISNKQRRRRMSSRCKRLHPHIIKDADSTRVLSLLLSHSESPSKP